MRWSCFLADRPHPAHLDTQDGDFNLLVQSWTKQPAACYAARAHSSLYTWTLLTSYFLQVDVEVEGPFLSTFDELMIHVDPTENISILLLEFFMFHVTPYLLLLDQGKPILVSGLALQAEFKSSTAVESKAHSGEVTLTAEICSRPRPALVRVAFDVHFGYHTRYSDRGEKRRSSAFSSPDCSAAKDSVSVFRKCSDMLRRGWSQRVEGVLQRDH